MSALPLVQKLRDMARDPGLRSVIEGDATMMAGLGNFLENEDVEIVRTALETMDYLSDRVQCARNFAPAVKKQMIYGAGSNKKLAQSVYVKMQACGAVGSAPSSHKRPLGEITNTRGMSPLTARRKAGHAADARTTHIFNIPELDEDLRDQIEGKLLMVPGILSFTMDIEAGTLTVRAAETDTAALKRRLHDQYDIPVMIDSKSEASPDYLPEPSEASSKSQSAGWGSWLVSFGAPTQKPKPKQREKNAPTSWAPWASGLKTVGQGLGVL